MCCLSTSRLRAPKLSSSLPSAFVPELEVEAIVAWRQAYREYRLGEMRGASGEVANLLKTQDKTQDKTQTKQDKQDRSCSRLLRRINSERTLFKSSGGDAEEAPQVAIQEAYQLPKEPSIMSLAPETARGDASTETVAVARSVKRVKVRQHQVLVAALALGCAVGPAAALAPMRSQARLGRVTSTRRPVTQVRISTLDLSPERNAFDDENERNLESGRQAQPTWDEARGGGAPKAPTTFDEGGVTSFQDLDLGVLEGPPIQEGKEGGEGKEGPELGPEMANTELGREGAQVKRLLRRAVANVPVPKWNLRPHKMSKVSVGTFKTAESDKAAAAPDGGAGKEEEGKVDLKHEILTMTLPLLAVWLAGPILSIIDTAVVGRTGGFVELAALGPATALCDNLAYFFNFLCIVTTSQVAAALVRDDKHAASRATGDGIFSAVSIGLATSLLLLVGPLGPSALGLFGNGASAAYLDSALAYVRIRAVGLVFGMCGSVYQSACLARRDTRAPLLSVGLAAVANLVLDLMLVMGCGLGARGAAWASVAAQVAAFACLQRNEARHTRAYRLAMDGAEEVGDVLDSPNRAKRGARDRLECLSRYLKQCVSPSAALAGKCATTIACALAASGCGAVGLAAHQVSISVMFIFTPFGEALSQTAQAVLPATNARPKLKDREAVDAAVEAHVQDAVLHAQASQPQQAAKAQAGDAEKVAADAAVAEAVQAVNLGAVQAPQVLHPKTQEEQLEKVQTVDEKVLLPRAKKLATSLIGAAVGLGGLNAFFAASTLFFGSFLFTTDALVQAQVAACAPFVFAILLLHSVSTTVEGVLFTTGDAGFLGRIYPVNSMIFSTVFVALKSQGAPLTAIWKVLALYNWTRASQFVARLLWNQRQASQASQAQPKQIVAAVAIPAAAEVNPNGAVEAVLDSIMPPITLVDLACTQGSPLLEPTDGSQEKGLA